MKQSSPGSRMTMELTPRERVRRALLGEEVDKVPFTIYETMFPQCSVERELRNMGVCIVDRTVPLLTTHCPDVMWTQTEYMEGDKTLVRTGFDTPFGEVHDIKQKAGFTSWRRKHLFCGPEDYRRLVFLIDNESYQPDYEAFTIAEDVAGEDCILRGGIGNEPLQHIISEFMGTEVFCLEWMDRRDEVIRLYEALVRAARRRYPLLADSPAWHFNYGGNVVPEIIGPKVFEEMYLPHYREAAEALHAKGKLVGCHFDANTRAIASLINESGLDYIEAFTPAPDTDMTLAEAFEAWPDKCIWINFPSSLFLTPPTRIAEYTRELLRDARGNPRFIIGITENAPPDRWQAGFLAIARTIDGFHSRVEKDG